MPIGVGMIGSTLAGGVMGMIASSGQRAAFEKATSEALAILDAVPQPPDRTAEILIEKYKQAGVLTPEMEQKLTLDGSKLAQVQEDKGPRAAQVAALTMLQQRGAGGLTPKDRAAFNQLRMQMASDQQAKQAQIEQEYASRGQAGSGSELASRLLASQAGADRMSAQGDTLAATASQNALQALMQAGQLGGQLRGQDWDINAAKAQAQDALNQFNIQNQISRQQRNVDRSNTAQQYNLGNAQQILTGNVDAANREKYRQDQARQDLWNSQLQLAQAKANARVGAGQMYAQQAQNTAQNWAGLGSGLGSAIGAYGLYSQRQPSSSGGGYGGDSSGSYSGVPRNPWDTMGR